MRRGRRHGHPLGGGRRPRRTPSSRTPCATASADDPAKPVAVVHRGRSTGARRRRSSAAAAVPRRSARPALSARSSRAPRLGTRSARRTVTARRASAAAPRRPRNRTPRARSPPTPPPSAPSARSPRPSAYAQWRRRPPTPARCPSTRTSTRQRRRRAIDGCTANGTAASPSAPTDAAALLARYGITVRPPLPAPDPDDAVGRRPAPRLPRRPEDHRPASAPPRRPRRRTAGPRRRGRNCAGRTPN